MQTSMNIRHGEIVRTSLAKEMKRDMWGAILIASHPAFNFEFSTMDRNVHDCFISQVSSSLEVLPWIRLGAVGAHKEHGCPVLVVFDAFTYMTAQITLALVASLNHKLGLLLLLFESLSLALVHRFTLRSNVFIAKDL